MVQGNIYRGNQSGLICRQHEIKNMLHGGREEVFSMFSIVFLNDDGCTSSTFKLKHFKLAYLMNFDILSFLSLTFLIILYPLFCLQLFIAQIFNDFSSTCMASTTLNFPAQIYRIFLSWFTFSSARYTNLSPYLFLSLPLSLMSLSLPLSLLIFFSI